MKIAATCCGLAVLFLGGEALGAIVTLSNGNASWSELTGSVDFSTGTMESDNTTYIFQEQSGLTLSNDLTVNSTDDGTFTSDTPVGTATIAAGTTLDSYFIHFDPVNQDPAGNVSQENMTVEFDSDIIGFIYETDLLNDTDGILGDSDSIYTPIWDFRGTLDNPLDQGLTVSGNTLTVSWNSQTNFGEQLRVVTLAPAAVPEPSSMILLGLTGVVGLGAGWRRRRQTASKAVS